MSFPEKEKSACQFRIKEHIWVFIDPTIYILRQVKGQRLARVFDLLVSDHPPANSIEFGIMKLEIGPGISDPEARQLPNREMLANPTIGLRDSIVMQCSALATDTGHDRQALVFG